MAKWQGTPVPNSGYVENVYFNTTLSVEEVVELLNKYDTYAFLVTSDFSSGIVSNFDDEGLIIANELTGDIYFNTKGEDYASFFGWNSNITYPILVNKEVTSEVEGMLVGSQNAQLSTLFSITPFTKDISLNSFLTGIADAIRSKKGTTDKINASNFANEIASITGGGGASAVIKTLPSWKGTTVPESGLVEKIYFNTDLTREEVSAICDTLTFVDGSAIASGYDIWSCFSDMSMTNGIMISKPQYLSQLGVNYYMIVLSINGESTTLFAGGNGEETEDNVGWIEGIPNVVEFNIDNQISTIGPMLGLTPENEKTKALFSINPFIYGEDMINLSGEYQAIQLDIVENGEINIEENIVTNKEIPFKIKVDVPIPEDYIKPEGTIEFTISGTTEKDVKEYEKAKIYVDNSKVNEVLTKSNLTTYSNDTITAIRKYLFYNYTTLKNVYFSYVRYIDDGAFEGCTSLTSFSSDAHINEIGKYAFKNCTSLNQLNCLSYASKIGDEAFENCTTLTSAIFDGTKIGHRAFAGCTSLKTIQFNNLEEFRHTYPTFSTFEGCTSLTKITSSNFPKLKTLGGDTFKNCTSLYSFESNTVEQTSGMSTFRECSALKDVQLPLLKNVGYYMFKDCISLVELNLPSVTLIGVSCFEGCTSLETISLPLLESIEGSGGSIFEDCSKLKTINLPKFPLLTPYMFSNCSSLIDIYLGYEGAVTLQHTSAFSGVTKGLKVHVRSEYADQYATATNWQTLIDNGTVVIVGDYTE